MIDFTLSITMLHLLVSKAVIKVITKRNNTFFSYILSYILYLLLIKTNYKHLSQKKKREKNWNESHGTRHMLQRNYSTQYINVFSHHFSTVFHSISLL